MVWLDLVKKTLNSLLHFFFSLRPAKTLDNRNPIGYPVFSSKIGLTKMRKLIGRGSFSKVYQVGPNEVEVVTECPTKEAYARFSQKNRLAPRVELTNKPDHFKMPLYPKMKALRSQLNEDGYRLYRSLRRLYLDSGWFLGGYQQICNKVKGLSEISPEERRLVCSLAKDMTNLIPKDRLFFEISPRNITCDDQGNLILLDCFFKD